MAGEHRQTPTDLKWLGRLAAAPHRYGFFTVLRRLEALFRDRPRIGYAARPRDEVVRVAQQPNLGFAPSTLAAFEPREGRVVGRLFTNFFGLLGPNGPLPLHLTEHAYERLVRHRDGTFARFLDLFQHRFAMLFYRAWADAQPAVQYDRPGADRFADYVGSVFGIGMPAMRRRDAVPDEAKLRFAGHLSCQTRHADGLRALLEAFFRVPVEVEEFVGAWLEIPDECRLRLTRASEAATLGTAAVLGSRVWDRRQTFRIALGPMPWRLYRRLLPGESGLRMLADLVKNYAGLTLRWDVRLVLRRDEIPPFRLGDGVRLGYGAWLGSRSRSTDARDLVLRRGFDAPPDKKARPKTGSEPIPS